MNNIREKVSQILMEFGVDLKSPTPINRQLNSIALVELILRLEKEFQIEISPLEYDPSQFDDLSTIVDFLQKKSME